MGAIYEVYIDVLAMNNFLADLAALLAVKVFLHRKARARRILLGALLGSLISSAVFAICKNMAQYLLIVHFLLNPLILLFSFRERSRKDFFADLCAGYFAFLLIGGIMEWLYAGGHGLLAYEPAAAVCLLLFTWGVLWARRQVKNNTKYVTAYIQNNGRKIQIQALCDSGNLLHDPYLKKPVSMIGRKDYEEAFGQPQPVRYIPYKSLGCSHGLIEAVTVEELSFTYQNREQHIRQAVLGLAGHELFDKKTYQMILNPVELSEDNTEN